MVVDANRFALENVSCDAPCDSVECAPETTNKARRDDCADEAPGVPAQIVVRMARKDVLGRISVGRGKGGAK